MLRGAAGLEVLGLTAIRVYGSFGLYSVKGLGLGSRPVGVEGC